MDDDKCNQWVEEAEKQSEWSPKDAAELFNEAAECFDRQGRRKQAAVYFTIAGQFFLDLNLTKQAGELFGKAIIRNIIADDMEAAEILLKKAEEYNFDSFQFRLAHDRFSKKFEALEDEQLKAEIDVFASEDERLMEVVDLESYGEFEEISSIEQLSEDNVLRGLMEQTSSDDILPSVSEFVFKEDPSKRIAMEDMSGDRIMESVLKRSRGTSFSPIETSVIARTESGSSRVLKSRTRIRPSVSFAGEDLVDTSTGLGVGSGFDDLKLESIDGTTFESRQDSLRVKTAIKSISSEEPEMISSKSGRIRTDLEKKRGIVPGVTDLDLEAFPDVPDLEEVAIDSELGADLTVPPSPGAFIPTERELASKLLDMASSSPATLPEFDAAIDPGDLPEFGQLESILADILPAGEELDRKTTELSLPPAEPPTAPLEVITREPGQQETTTLPSAALPPGFDKPVFDLEGIPVMDLDNIVTMKSEFITESEITNEFDQDLEDVEIIDTIPFSWQIKEIKDSEFELVSRKAQTDQGVVFTWKRKRLAKGETARIEYVVVKRIQRSIVTKQEHKFSLVNTYHSLSGFDSDIITARIEFVNTSDKSIDHLLIEDLIPPEFTVRRIDSGKHHSIQLPTKESVIYRWVIENMAPGESLTTEYVLAEKQLVRWYRQRFTHWIGGNLAVEKIIQPITDIEEDEYLLYLDVETEFSTSLQILDQVPPGTTAVFYHPAWLRPEILSHGDSHFLGWQMQLEDGEHLQALLRLKTRGPFNSQEPVVKIEGLKSQEKREKLVRRITEKINLKEKTGLRY